MDPAPEIPLKRLNIALKLPAPLQERMMAFPMLHLLRDAYPEAVFHFISPKHKIEVLFALPFEAFWYPWDEEEIKTPFDTHRFATQLKVPEIDIFICLGDTAKELALGKLLRAKKVVGFASGWKKILTDLPIERPRGYHLYEEWLKIFRELTNQRLPEKLSIKGKELQPFYPTDGAPYVAVNLFPFAPGKIDTFWEPFFSLHEGKRFVLFFSEDEAQGALIAENVMKRFSSRNTYELFVSADWIDLGRMLTGARGLISRSGAVVSYATYLGADTLVIYESGEPRKDAPIPFFANWQVLDLRDPTLASDKVKSGALKEKPQVNPMVLFERCQKMFYF